MSHRSSTGAALDRRQGRSWGSSGHACHDAGGLRRQRDPGVGPLCAQRRLDAEATAVH